MGPSPPEMGLRSAIRRVARRHPPSAGRVLVTFGVLSAVAWLSPPAREATAGAEQAEMAAPPAETTATPVNPGASCPTCCAGDPAVEEGGNAFRVEAWPGVMSPREVQAALCGGETWISPASFLLPCVWVLRPVEALRWLVLHELRESVSSGGLKEVELWALPVSPVLSRETHAQALEGARVLGSVGLAAPPQGPLALDLSGLHEGEAVMLRVLQTTDGRCAVGAISWTGDLTAYPGVETATPRAVDIGPYEGQNWMGFPERGDAP